jgi:hypothetical protein
VRSTDASLSPNGANAWRSRATAIGSRLPEPARSSPHTASTITSRETARLACNNKNASSPS